MKYKKSILILTISTMLSASTIRYPRTFDIINTTKTSLYYSIGNNIPANPMLRTPLLLKPGSRNSKPLTLSRKTKLLISQQKPKKGDPVAIYEFPANKTIYIQAYVDENNNVALKPQDPKLARFSLENNVTSNDIKKIIARYRISEQEKNAEIEKEWKENVQKARKAFWKWHLKTTKSKLLQELKQLMELQESLDYFNNVIAQAPSFLGNLTNRPPTEQEKAIKEKAEEISTTFVIQFKDKGASDIHEPKIRFDVYKLLKQLHAQLKAAQDIPEKVLGTQPQKIIAQALEWLEEKVEEAINILEQIPEEQQGQEARKQAQAITILFFKKFEEKGAIREKEAELAEDIYQAIKDDLETIKKETKSPEQKKADQEFLKEIRQKATEKIEKEWKENVQKARKAFWKWHLKTTKSKLLQELKQLMELQESLDYFNNVIAQAPSFLGNLINLPPAEREKAIKEKAEEISTAFVIQFKDKGASDIHEPKIRFDVYKLLKQLHEQLKVAQDIPEKVLKSQPQKIREQAIEWIAEKGEETIVLLEQIQEEQQDQEARKAAQSITELFFKEFEGANREKEAELEQIIYQELKESLKTIKKETKSSERKKADQEFLEEIRQKAKEIEEKRKEKESEEIESPKAKEWKTWKIEKIESKIERLEDEKEELNLTAGREKIKQTLVGAEEGPVTKRIRQIDEDLKILKNVLDIKKAE